MTISLSCTVEQYVSVLPSTWIKLEGYEGDKITQQVTVTTIEEKPLTITKITCDINDKIKYKLKSKKKGKEYVLEVRNRIAPVGTFHGTIELKTTSEKKPTLVINVYANFLEEVKVEPQVVSFGVIDTSKENFDAPNMKKIVTITDMRGSGLTLNKIKSSGDWIVAENQKRGGRQYNLVIGVDKNKLPKGRFQEKITIRTNYKQKKSLLINVNGEVL